MYNYQDVCCDHAKSGFALGLWDVKIVTYVNAQPLNHSVFGSLCKSMETPGSFSASLRETLILLQGCADSLVCEKGDLAKFLYAGKSVSALTMIKILTCLRHRGEQW